MLWPSSNYGTLRLNNDDDDDDDDDDNEIHLVRWTHYSINEYTASVISTLWCTLFHIVSAVT